MWIYPLIIEENTNQEIHFILIIWNNLTVTTWKWMIYFPVHSQIHQH
jgi:hypothetical protein